MLILSALAVDRDATACVTVICLVRRPLCISSTLPVCFAVTSVCQYTISFSFFDHNTARFAKHFTPALVKKKLLFLSMESGGFEHSDCFWLNKRILLCKKKKGRVSIGILSIIKSDTYQAEPVSGKNKPFVDVL